ncbi:unnamed protein product [Effrenium voratum]|nr:unnamed protein product [Effrenium voratum]
MEESPEPAEPVSPTAQPAFLKPVKPETDEALVAIPEALYWLHSEADSVSALLGALGLAEEKLHEELEEERKNAAWDWDSEAGLLAQRQAELLAQPPPGKPLWRKFKFSRWAENGWGKFCAARKAAEAAAGAAAGADPEVERQEEEGAGLEAVSAPKSPAAGIEADEEQCLAVLQALKFGEPAAALSVPFAQRTAAVLQHLGARLSADWRLAEGPRSSEVLHLTELVMLAHQHGRLSCDVPSPGAQAAVRVLLRALVRANLVRCCTQMFEEGAAEMYCGLPEESEDDPVKLHREDVPTDFFDPQDPFLSWQEPGQASSPVLPLVEVDTKDNPAAPAPRHQNTEEAVEKAWGKIVSRLPSKDLEVLSAWMREKGSLDFTNGAEHAMIWAKPTAALRTQLVVLALQLLEQTSEEIPMPSAPPPMRGDWPEADGPEMLMNMWDGMVADLGYLVPSAPNGDFRTEAPGAQHRRSEWHRCAAMWRQRRARPRASEDEQQEEEQEEVVETNVPQQEMQPLPDELEPAQRGGEDVLLSDSPSLARAVQDGACGAHQVREADP